MGRLGIASFQIVRNHLNFLLQFHASVVTFHWRREQYRHVTGTRKLQRKPVFRSTGGVGREIIDTFSASETIFGYSWINLKSIKIYQD